MYQNKPFSYTNNDPINFKINTTETSITKIKCPHCLEKIVPYPKEVEERGHLESMEIPKSMMFCFTWPCCLPCFCFNLISKSCWYQGIKQKYNFCTNCGKKMILLERTSEPTSN